MPKGTTWNSENIKFSQFDLLRTEEEERKRLGQKKKKVYTWAIKIKKGKYSQYLLIPLSFKSLFAWTYQTVFNNDKNTWRKEEPGSLFYKTRNKMDFSLHRKPTILFGFFEMGLKKVGGALTLTTEINISNMTNCHVCIMQ